MIDVEDLLSQGVRHFWRTRSAQRDRQRGMEAVMGVMDEVEKYREDIVTDTYTVTWRELIGQYKDGDLAIDPEYQRLFRWDIDQQTQYIESILLNIPSPPLFLARNADAKFEVIDGLQRISTILKFFAAEVRGTTANADNEVQEIEQNNLSMPTKLAAGPLVPSLDEFTAQTLPETLVRTVRYARITVILLEKESSTRARYEVFRRLNKLGSPLSDQEIRNCTARLLGKEFPTELRKLAERDAVRSALDLPESAELRMGVEETLLRLLALNFSKKPLKHQIREYLDDFMAEASEGKFKLTDDVTETIEKTFRLINETCPNGKAFRFPSGGFSTNLFDVVATGAFVNLPNLTPASFKSKFESLMSSDELKALVGAGSNTRKKLQGRVELGRTWFAA